MNGRLALGTLAVVMTSRQRATAGLPVVGAVAVIRQVEEHRRAAALALSTVRQVGELRRCPESKFARIE